MGSKQEIQDSLVSFWVLCLFWTQQTLFLLIYCRQLNASFVLYWQDQGYLNDLFQAAFVSPCLQSQRQRKRGPKILAFSGLSL